MLEENKYFVLEIEEKGDELLDKMYDKILELHGQEHIECAIIAVDLILDLYKDDVYLEYSYWEKVKKYLESLIKR